MNEGYAEEPNPYRVAGPVVEINFGLIEIDWSAESGPLVYLKVVGVDNSIALEYTVPVSRRVDDSPHGAPDKGI